MNDTNERMTGKGPVYGVDLIESLPISGGMRQAMPSRHDLEQIKEINERVLAGYEVAIAHLAAANERAEKAEADGQGSLKAAAYWKDNYDTLRTELAAIAEATGGDSDLDALTAVKQLREDHDKYEEWYFQKCTQLALAERQRDAAVDGLERIIRSGCLVKHTIRGTLARVREMGTAAHDEGRDG